MTLEGHDPGAEETPAPPASTRWSEASAEDEDVLLPPYVPGAPRGHPAESGSATPGETDRSPEPELDEESPETDAGAGEEPWPAEDDGGFSEPWGEGDVADSWTEMEVPETEAPADEASYAEPVSQDSALPAGPEASAGPGDVPGGYPWDDGGTAGFPEMEEGPGEAVEASEAEVFEGYDLGAGDDEGLADAAAEVEERGEPGDEEMAGGGLPGLPEPLPETDPRIPAERLEMLAEILRREGPSGIQREVASRDRLTSLLAGVVAGYLAGLEG